MSTVCRVARRRFELAGEYFREVRLVAHAAARVRGYRTHPTCDPITTAGARHDEQQDPATGCLKPKNILVHNRVWEYTNIYISQSVS